MVSGRAQLTEQRRQAELQARSIGDNERAEIQRRRADSAERRRSQAADADSRKQAGDELAAKLAARRRALVEVADADTEATQATSSAPSADAVDAVQAEQVTLELQESDPAGPITGSQPAPATKSAHCSSPVAAVATPSRAHSSVKPNADVPPAKQTVAEDVPGADTEQDVRLAASSQTSRREPAAVDSRQQVSSAEMISRAECQDVPCVDTKQEVRLADSSRCVRREPAPVDSRQQESATEMISTAEYQALQTHEVAVRPVAFADEKLEPLAEQQARHVQQTKCCCSVQ
eukprot:TRINITY_DN14821_c0_g1_i1.p1 TRINITY_DN14821_c0_g1~~TRINITY_DN14821_c0_g1_i1.p1  ORF type:complete len:325 (+),score=81.34 TRINITY_DN14821_c0_g1_i1:108-977(+)